MNIYVVSKLWREHGTLGNGMVIGAGVELEDAQKVADRWDCSPGKWGAWVADPGPGARSQRWTREVIGRDGRTFGQNAQEIVCIPLAGVPTVDEFTRDWVDRVNEQISFTPPVGPGPVTYPFADDERAEWLTRDSVIESWREMVRKLSHPTGPIRVGTGAARQWLERAMDAMPGKSKPATSQMSGLMGVPVVYDASIPPDQIRHGHLVYTVGTPDNPLAQPGQMVVIDTSQPRFTSPPG